MAGEREPMVDVLPALRRCVSGSRRIRRETRCCNLAQFGPRSSSDSGQLTDQNDLKQRPALVVDVRQQPDLLEDLRLQVLRLVDDDDGVAPIGESERRNACERFDQVVAGRRATWSGPSR